MAAITEIPKDHWFTLKGGTVSHTFRNIDGVLHWSAKIRQKRWVGLPYQLIVQIPAILRAWNTTNTELKVVLTNIDMVEEPHRQNGFKIELPEHYVMRFDHMIKIKHMDVIKNPLPDDCYLYVTMTPKKS